MDERIMNILGNLIRVGKVDKIYDDKGKIRVTFPDRDDLIADDVAMLDFEQNFPEIGDSVLCLFLPNGILQGFCLGTFYNEKIKPPIPDRKYYVKEIDEGLSFEYDKDSKKLTIRALNEITLEGDFFVNGTITSRGAGS